VSALNPAQRDAVLQTEGPVLVLAGAGSGKTRVITSRIAYIMHQRLATASEILAVTFTNKAAAEMRTRVTEIIGKKAGKELVVSTFHSFCLGILRTNIEHLGYRKNFTISSDGDSRALVNRVVDEMNTEEKSYSPGAFQAMISLYKNSDLGSGGVRAKPVESENDEKYHERMEEMVERYASSLRAANSIDFDDLLLFTLKLWREHPKFLAEARKQFKYVMVDEYQDTNAVQYSLLQLLTEKHRNFCVVGDDDQAIYAWRGADSGNILDFEKRFPEAKIVTLDQNYRSTETILAAANSVIKNNGARREKKLWSDLGKGRPIDCFVVGSEEDEAKEAVKWLKNIQSKTGAKYSDFALLYRSNTQSKPLEIVFRQAGIPYVVIGGQEFFDRAEIRDIISYLKVLVNPRNETALLRIVNMPRRGIGDTTLHRVHDLCRLSKKTFTEGMKEALKEGIVHGTAEKGMRDLLGMLAHFRTRLRERDGTLREIVEDLVGAMDYYGELERTCKNAQHALSRWQNVVSLLEAVGDYEKNAETPTLSSFLDESHLNTDSDRGTKNERRNRAVTLMTIHSAKGLEFPFVFVMGVEDGLLPHERSIREGQLDEERRLFYVALTRGKRHVTLFETLSRAKFGKEKPSKTSRFMTEIPEELLRRQIRAVRGMAAAAEETPKPKKKRARKRQAG
jgi:superfamily I DNA/RNA helicase